MLFPAHTSALHRIMDLRPYILHCDDALIVLNKPAGIAVHPGPRTPASLEDGLVSLRLGRRSSPIIMHRLDRDTGGCLLLARTADARRWITQAFEARAIAKTYRAKVSAPIDPPEGMIDAPLAKVSSAENGWRMVVRTDGDPARTRYHTLEDGQVELQPETGRTHQLRVHMAHLGAPIIGDPVYGAGGGPLCLYARALAIPCPDGTVLRVSAPPPEHMV